MAKEMVHLSHEHDAGRRHFDPQFFLSMEDARRRVLPPEEVLRDFLPSDDAALADIGAGAGFFALPAARYLSGGHVYAVDRQEDMLALLRRRAAEAGLENIVPVLSDAKALPLEGQSVDAVLMANVFHDIGDQSAMLSEVGRILRPQGAFYLVEWDKVETEMGPPQEIRIAPPDLEQALRDGGFAVEHRFQGPSPFYRILARKA